MGLIKKSIFCFFLPAMKDGALGVKGEEQRVDPASVAETLW